MWPAIYLLQGMDRHRPLVVFAVGSAVLNLALSIWLVRVPRRPGRRDGDADRERAARCCSSSRTRCTRTAFGAAARCSATCCPVTVPLVPAVLVAARASANWLEPGRPRDDRAGRAVGAVVYRAIFLASPRPRVSAAMLPRLARRGLRGRRARLSIRPPGVQDRRAPVTLGRCGGRHGSSCSSARSCWSSAASATPARARATITVPSGFQHAHGVRRPRAADRRPLRARTATWCSSPRSAARSRSSTGCTTPRRHEVVNLRREVYNNGDRGLLGLAVDPEFAAGNAVRLRALHARRLVRRSDRGDGPPTWRAGRGATDPDTADAGQLRPSSTTRTGCEVSRPARADRGQPGHGREGRRRRRTPDRCVRAGASSSPRTPSATCASGPTVSSTSAAATAPGTTPWTSASSATRARDAAGRGRRDARTGRARRPADPTGLTGRSCAWIPTPGRRRGESVDSERSTPTGEQRIIGVRAAQPLSGSRCARHARTTSGSATSAGDAGRRSTA